MFWRRGTDRGAPAVHVLALPDCRRKDPFDGRFDPIDERFDVTQQPVIVHTQPVIVQQATPQVVAVPSQERLPTVTCESTDGRRNHCAVMTTSGVRLLRQMSDSNSRR